MPSLCLELCADFYLIASQEFSNSGIASREDNLVLFRKRFKEGCSLKPPIRIHIQKIIVQDYKTISIREIVTKYSKTEG